MRREAAVRAAADLFLERGIENVKMTDVADASSLGVASLYRYFGTKTNMAIEVGTLLWHRIPATLVNIAAAPSFEQATGRDQLERLLQGYTQIYREHPEYVAFLDSFDHLMLAEDVQPEKLRAYDQELHSFFPVFSEAYHKGKVDGSLPRDVDFVMFYRTISHALMRVAAKFIRGDITPSDDVARDQAELDMLVAMAIGYLAEE